MRSVCDKEAFHYSALIVRIVCKRRVCRIPDRSLAVRVCVVLVCMQI